MRKVLTLITLTLIFLVCCSQQIETFETSHEQFAKNSDSDHQSVRGEELFHNRRNMGTVENSEIDEASGLVASRQNPGVLWTHNDSGGSNAIFAMDEEGRNLGTYTVRRAINRDWEDIAIGKNPTSGVDEVYVADIGDNRLINNIKQIYVVSEPVVSLTQKAETAELNLSQIISFTYPDNLKYDAETLLFDQQSSTFYVITKKKPQNEEDFERIFAVEYSSDSEIQVATYVGNVAIPSDKMIHYGATGGDISPDGNFILIKNYQAIYIWQRRGLSIPETLRQPSIKVPYIMEPQGEAVAWRYDGSGYFTLSEVYANVPAVLYFYGKKR